MKTYSDSLKINLHTTEILLIIKPKNHLIPSYFIYINCFVLCNVRNTCTYCNLRLIILMSCQKLFLIIVKRGHHVVYWMWRRGSASNELTPIDFKICVQYSLFWMKYIEKNANFRTEFRFLKKRTREISKKIDKW